MKTILWSLFAGGVMAACGCWPHLPYSIVQEPAQPAAPPATTVAPRPLRPPVIPEQVTPDNARAMAQALLDEVDREQAGKGGELPPR
jgi:hypothetical protein